MNRFGNNLSDIVVVPSSHDEKAVATVATPAEGCRSLTPRVVGMKKAVALDVAKNLAVAFGQLKRRNFRRPFETGEAVALRSAILTQIRAVISVWKLWMRVELA